MPAGVAPVDTSTLVGQLRLMVGDLAFTPLTPPVDGEGEYGFFGDDQLAQWIAAASGSVLRAAGLAYMQLAANESLTGASIKTDDLAVDTTKRGTNLAAIAQSFFAEATAADAAGSADIFEILEFVEPWRDVEGMPTPWRVL